MDKISESNVLIENNKRSINTAMPIEDGEDNGGTALTGGSGD